MTDQHFWKIHVTFDDPEEMGMAGESLHGTRIGDGPEPNTGLYSLDNIPFFAELRMDDVVLCDESDPSVIPEVIRVHKQGDCPTARVLFTPGVPDENMITVMGTLRLLGAKTERAQREFWVLALPADADQRDTAILVLEGAAQAELLMYEIVGDDDDEE